uniref:Uncharacterized protein n=1 Tax=Amphimedon queenslandica TaxID=400682 RepID=A0A1X7T7S5_AMPQE
MVETVQFPTLPVFKEVYLSSTCRLCVVAGVSSEEFQEVQSVILKLLFMMWQWLREAFNLIAVALPRRPLQETASGAGRAAAIIANDNRIWCKNEDDHCFLVEPQQEVGTNYFYRKEEMVACHCN